MDTRNIPSEGIRYVHVERLASDARVQGALDATLLTVTFSPSEISGEPYSIEGEMLRFQDGVVEQVILPPDIHLAVSTAGGDLRLQELTGPVEVMSIHGDLRLKDLAGRIRIGQVDGDLRADNVADLTVQQGCQGDLRAQKVGKLAVETISGDAHVYQAGTAHLGQVQGDLWAEKLAGTLEVARSGGDVHLSEIAGLVSIDHISGDLHTTDLSGGLAAPDVAGGVLLRGSFGAEASHKVTAGGDLVVHLLPASDLRLTAQAEGRIRSDIQLTPAPDGSTTFTATLGRGTARIDVKCNGDMRIIQVGGERTGDEASTYGEDLGERFRQQFRPPFSDDWSDLGERIRQQVQASLAAAGIDFAGGQFPFEHGSRPGKPGRQVPPRPVPPERPTRTAPPPPPSGPTEAEQMAILKMLEAGTISAAEAEMLLKALGTQG